MQNKYYGNYTKDEYSFTFLTAKIFFLSLLIDSILQFFFRVSHTLFFLTQGHFNI